MILVRAFFRFLAVYLIFTAINFIGAYGESIRPGIDAACLFLMFLGCFSWQVAEDKWPI